MLKCSRSFILIFAAPGWYMQTSLPEHISFYLSTGHLIIKSQVRHGNVLSSAYLAKTWFANIRSDVGGCLNIYSEMAQCNKLFMWNTFILAIHIFLIIIIIVYLCWCMLKFTNTTHISDSFPCRVAPIWLYFKWPPVN